MYKSCCRKWQQKPLRPKKPATGYRLSVGSGKRREIESRTNKKNSKKEEEEEKKEKSGQKSNKNGGFF